jgi:flagellar hook-associated protein 1 FlgK
MADSNLLSIGSSGLQAFQRSLNTIGHNIANVNTEGYSKQNVDLSSRNPQINGYGFAGTGVQTTTISRSYDSFIEGNLRNTTASAAEFEVFHALASQIDNVLADPDSGMSTSMQSFFNAIQDVADTPSAIAPREVLLEEGKHLAGQFNELSNWLESVRGQVNSDVRGSVAEINRLSVSIAELNESIVIQQGRSNNQPVNDLLDQRDLLIRDLSELVSITTVQQDDGAINVLSGIGQVLVVGSRASTLEVFVEANDPNQLGIAIKGSGGALVPITEQLSGGRVGGLLSFRDRMLDPASNSLGLVAIGLSHFVNEQQKQGMDLDSALGAEFFNVAKPQALTLVGAPGNVSVAFDDVSQLTNSDYKLRFNGGSWQLTQKDTNQVIAMTGSGTAVDPFIAEGLRFEITAAPTNGDVYLIRPTRDGATDIKMALVNNRQIAAAAPLRSLTSVTNTGTGQISAGNVSDINNSVFQATSGQLSPPVLVRFTTATSYDIYDNSNSASPVLLEAGIAYNPTTGGDVFPTPSALDHGYRLQLKGAPAAGDEFSTEYNAGGVGDNRNALLLANLANNKLMANGSASVTDSYIVMVADVGAETKQAELKSVAQKGILDKAIASRESVSGVNLDEEAANLIRFQQAYQAAAQVITVANTMFDSLLNAVRR